MSLFGNMYIGYTGLYTDTVGLKVSGNNITNLNTTGYKKDRMEFMNNLVSDTNEVFCAEKGIGCYPKSIRTIFDQGGLQTTDNPTDLAISGKGFFIVQDQKGNIYYTRDGQFFVNEVDENHLALQNSLGMFLLGATPDAQTADLQTLQPYLIPKIMNAKATETIKASLILDSRVQTNNYTLVDKYDAQTNPQNPIPENNYDWVYDWYIYDSKGERIPVRLYVDRGDSPNKYEVLFALDDPALDGRGSGKLQGAFLYGELTFGNAGNIYSADFYQVAPDGTLTQLDLTQTGKPQVTLNINGTQQTLTLDLGFTVNQDGSIKREEGAIKMIANPFTQLEYNQDGYPEGIFDHIEVITENGLIEAYYTNGKTIDVSKIFLADFSGYEDTLIKTGENLFKAKAGTTPTLFAPGKQERGTLISGALETSNVDLADEMVRLIVLQRAFQSNSRVITTSDELLQEFLRQV